MCNPNTGRISCLQKVVNMWVVLPLKVLFMGGHESLYLCK